MVRGAIFCPSVGGSDIEMTSFKLIKIIVFYAVLTSIGFGLGEFSPFLRGRPLLNAIVWIMPVIVIATLIFKIIQKCRRDNTNAAKAEAAEWKANYFDLRTPGLAQSQGFGKGCSLACRWIFSCGERSDCKISF